MIYHVLNGDALLPTFIETKLGGEIIVDRECLIEGDVSGDTLFEFWLTRGHITQYECVQFQLTLKDFMNKATGILSKFKATGEA